MSIIRTLTNDDLAEFRRLRLEALNTNPEAFAESPSEQAALSDEEAAKRIQCIESFPQKFVLGVFEGDVLSGIVGFSRDGRKKLMHRGNVWGMYVAKNARGKGLGKRLFSALLEKCRSLGGLEQVHLWASTISPEAEGLYRSCGFAACGREPNALRLEGGYVDLHHMILFL